MVRGGQCSWLGYRSRYGAVCAGVPVAGEERVITWIGNGADILWSAH